MRETRISLEIVKEDADGVLHAVPGRLMPVD
jgi:hypothetical protein